MKTDARVRYTVHMIQNVFLELLKEKPVAKITVKEICEHAEINRSTFYKHYQDVYDLMEKLENEAVEAFEKLLDSYVQNETVPALSHSADLTPRKSRTSFAVACKFFE